MRVTRSRGLRLAVASIATWALLTSPESHAQLPLEPIRESGQGVTGSFEGWYPNPDGSFTLLIGYFNRNDKATLDIPVGPNNRIDPDGPDHGQPTRFLPKRQWGVFTIRVPKDFGDKKLTWTLIVNGDTSTIPLSLSRQWAVQPFKDPSVGNTPPIVRLENTGPTHQGPPRGVAAALKTAVSRPLELTLWVNDDRIPDPVSLPKPGEPPITVFWSQARGTGSVTFANAKPDVGKADGKATTTATFTAPGEYLLRAQVNDYSGEGGGGNQCCWTNVLVGVSVTE
jgi:hypothetical protein